MHRRLQKFTKSLARNNKALIMKSSYCQPQNKVASSRAAQKLPPGSAVHAKTTATSSSDKKGDDKEEEGDDGNSSADNAKGMEADNRGASAKPSLIDRAASFSDDDLRDVANSLPIETFTGGMSTENQIGMIPPAPVTMDVLDVGSVALAAGASPIRAADEKLFDGVLERANDAESKRQSDKASGPNVNFTRNKRV